MARPNPINIVLFVVFMVCLSFMNVSSAVCRESGTSGEDDTQIQQLGSITVTAQKKKENVQKVPESISVISSQDIEDARLTESDEIHRLVPNLMTFGVNRGLDFPIFNIRGMGNLYEGDSGISFYIDDVPVTDPGLFSFALDNIERIEVLRGPQGTLYGMNTEGGVINIISRQAGDTFKGSVSAEYGSFNAYKVSGVLQGPVIKDRLSLGMSLMAQGTDGYVENISDGSDREGYTTFLGSANLQWDVSDRLNVQVNVSAEENDDGDWTWMVKNRDAYNAVWNAGIGEYEVWEDYQGHAENDSNRESVKISYQFPWARLVSVTSRLARSGDMGGDLDCTAMDYMSFEQSSEREQFSQEIRLVSPEDKETWSWILGLFYSSRDYETDQVFNFGSDYMMAFDQTTMVENEDETQAVFGQSTVRLLDERLGLTAGLRYEHAHRSTDRIRYYTINGVNYALDDPALGYMASEFSGKYNLDDSFDSFLPKFTLDYRFTPEIMAYTTAALGYKAGGFSMISNDPEVAGFEPEYAWTYEGGLKSKVLNGKLLVNLSTFYTNLEDYQDKITVDNVVTMRNAAKAKIYGCEAEIRFQPLLGLDISASAGLLHAEYDDYQDVENGKTVAFDGNAIAYVPDYQYSVAAQYRFESGIYLRGEFHGIGEMYFDRANTEKMSQDGYTILNAKVGYETERFDIYLFANNIFDKYYFTQLSDTTGYGIPGLNEAGFIGEPLTLGVTAKIRF